MSAPRVSIVMPVWNGARFLDEAIASVLAQDFADFELICVDDGSTDATPAILARHAAADARVRHFTNAANRGLPATLNRGFEEARAALLSWTSHDNLLRPAMLSTLVAALGDDADVAYAGYTVIDADGVPRRHVAPRPIDERLFGNVVGAAFLYRATVDRALGGYDEALFGAEDYDFWLRAARRFRFVAVDEDLYLYRRHRDSLTDTRPRVIRDMVAGLVLREAALVEDRGLRARAMLKLVTDDTDRPRLRLLARAFATDPAMVVRAAPRLARWSARVVLRRD